MRYVCITRHNTLIITPKTGPATVAVLQTSPSIVIPEPSFTAITDVQTPFAGCAGSLPPAPAACEYSGHSMPGIFSGKLKTPSRWLPRYQVNAAFLCGVLGFNSSLIHQVTVRFRCRAGGFENIAFVVLQCFQPGSDIAFMLNLSDNPQIRHQECASQLGIGSGGSCLRENMPLPPTEPDVIVSHHPALHVCQFPFPLRGFSVPACRALWHARHRTIRLRRLAAATCFQSGVSFISASLRL